MESTYLVKKTKNKNYFTGKKKGSILAYALIMLTMMLAIALSMSFTTIIEKKAASSTDFSVQAYQTADSGVQAAMQKINSNLNNKISDTFTSPVCVAGSVSAITDVRGISLPSGSSYTLSFYNGVGPSNCNDLVNTIKSIKSVGIYNDTIRAVSVGIDPGWLYDSACPTIKVYKTDVAGNPTWGPAANCPTGAGQPCSGSSPNVNLVADNTLDIFSSYPARNACKIVGGRLPTVAELICISNNKAVYGNNFQNLNYWSSGENLVITNADTVLFPGTTSPNLIKTSNIPFIRCVK